jgi:hypothetical protein
MVFTAGGAIGLIHCSDYSRDTIGNTASQILRPDIAARVVLFIRPQILALFGSI